MKVYHLRLCRFNNRRQSKIFLLILITIFNFAFGLFLISSIISNNEKQNISSKLSEREQIPSIITFTRKPFKSRYEYYFRIDYTIIQSICKPIYIFNTTKNILSIENLTSLKLTMLLSRNITIDIDIISINTILKKTDQIRQNSMYKSRKSLCNYVIELYIGFNFCQYCNNNCRLREIRRLSSNIQPFGDLLDKSFIFPLYSTNSFQSITLFNIHQMLIYQSSIYFNKLVYIRSFNENRYISSLIIDSDGYQSSITMSKIDRSLFIIKDGLDEKSFKRDSSTILISFLSTSVNNTYLRHESGRIKLGKNTDFILFKQDATFKLLFSKSNKDIIAFQSINLQHFFIGVDPETQTALTLTKPEQSPSKNIDSLDKRFLFKFIYNQ